MLACSTSGLADINAEVVAVSGYTKRDHMSNTLDNVQMTELVKEIAKAISFPLKEDNLDKHHGEG